MPLPKVIELALAVKLPLQQACDFLVPAMNIKCNKHNKSTVKSLLDKEEN